MIKFTDQEIFVLNILKKEGDITKLKAMHYNIGNVNAVINQLRRKGHHIGTLTRTDAQGRHYNEWAYLGYAGKDMRPTAIAKRREEHLKAALARRQGLTVVGGIDMSPALADAVTSLVPRGMH